LSLRTFKLVLAVFIGGFILAAAYISVLVTERQGALGKISVYNPAWEAGQAVSEFTRLEHRLAELDDPASGVDKDEVTLRYEILLNRATLLSEGRFQALIQNNPDHLITLRHFKETLAAITPLIADLETPGTARKILEFLKPLESRLAQLASVAHNYGTARMAQDQHELIRLHWLFSGLAAGLILIGIVLVGLLDRHNRLLGRAHEELHVLAHHDALTGLANRMQLRQQLEGALASNKHSDRTIAVLYIDLDHFKDVNDTFGHEIGDALLETVANRLRGCVRSESAIRAGDVVARLGGDEFAILQRDVSSRDDCIALASRIVEILGAPYTVKGQELVIGTSVGIALAPDERVTPGLLLKQADMALYRAKADGRGMFHFFEQAMDTQLQARRALEVDLREALANEEFELFYQPQVSIQANEVIGFEALLRWCHPERGLVSPAEFIPVAEDIGLIAQLGEWVVEQACLEATAWPKDLRIAVNLSPVQFRSKGLVQSVSRALEQSGLVPSRLELEITESTLLQDNEATVDTLHRLRRLGVRIALDDFGTGYSSLSYLRTFPFDKIKIDRSFVRELSSSNDCMAIVQSIASLGASLGMPTVAEGVETEDQFRQICAAGCTEVQGFYFGRPKPARELTFSLSEQSETAAA
jgi:diguanylate cyclase (GGDEF)-like protein